MCACRTVTLIAHARSGGSVQILVREYVFIVFTFHLVLVCFLFSFFSHFHEDITNLTEITCARRVAAGPGRVRVKIVISVTVTDSVYTGPSRLGVLSWAGRLRGAPLAVFADASVWFMPRRDCMCLCLCCSLMSFV